MVGYMKKTLLFGLLLAVCLNFLDLFAGSRAFLLRTPQFREAARRQFSSSVVNTPKPTSHLFSGYKLTNPSNFSSRYLGNKSNNFFTNTPSSKWRVPSIIATMLVLFETKHLITSSYREIEAMKAHEQIKNEPWTEEKQFAFEEITKKFQHTPKAAEQQKKLKLLQEKAIPLYLIFKRDGAAKFLHEMIAAHDDSEINKSEQLYAYKELFKKFTPEEKNELLASIKEQILNRKNEYEALTTKPGWFWIRRPKTEKFSLDEIGALHIINRELKILNEAKKIIEQS